MEFTHGGFVLVYFKIGGIHHRTIKNLPDGTFSLTELRSLIRGIDPHWPITTLVCIENTHNMKGGKALPSDWIDEVREGSIYVIVIRKMI